MEDLKNRLRNVEFTRKHASERDAKIQLVGNSQWIRDIELLLEDEWKSIFCHELAIDAAAGITDQLPALVLIEPEAHGEDTFRWIDLAAQIQSRTLLVAPEDFSQFEWMKITKKAAARDVGGILLPKDSKNAAVDLNNFLLDGVSLSAGRNQKDIRHIRSAAEGYELAKENQSTSLEREIFSMISDEFTLSSQHLGLSFLLLDTYSLWKRPKDTKSELHFSYRRIEREIEGSDSEKILRSSIAAAKSLTSGSFEEKDWADILKGAGYGLLAQRKLQKKYSDLQILARFHLDGPVKLKIA